MATRLKPTLVAPPVDPAADPTLLADYRPVRLKRTRSDGWTAERQRKFLIALAETGSISEACGGAGVSSRSAYRLRQRADAKSFAEAWDRALRLATIRLTTVAFERALKGTVRELWKDDHLIGTTRTPSDRMLMFLLQHLLPRVNAPSRLDAFDATVADIRAGFPAALDALTDHDVEMVPLHSRDFFPDAPGVPGDES